jgi:hypothetical protein
MISLYPCCSNLLVMKRLHSLKSDTSLHTLAKRTSCEIYIPYDGAKGTSQMSNLYNVLFDYCLYMVISKFQCI